MEFLSSKGDIKQPVLATPWHSNTFIKPWKMKKSNLAVITLKHTDITSQYSRLVVPFQQENERKFNTKVTGRYYSPSFI